jgi:hypothetical protein
MSQTETMGTGSWRESQVVTRWVEASMPEPIVRELRLLAFYAEASRPRIAKLVDRLNHAGMNPPNHADTHAATRQCLEAVLMLLETHARLARLLETDVVPGIAPDDQPPLAGSDQDQPRRIETTQGAIGLPATPMTHDGARVMHDGTRVMRDGTDARAA